MKSLSYYALLGSSPDLARFELATVLSRSNDRILKVIPDLGLVEFTLKDILPQNLLNLLGGTVKILMPINTAPDSFETSLVAFCVKNQLTACAFSSLSPDIPINKLAMFVKQALKAQSARFRFRLLASPKASAGILSEFPELVCAVLSNRNQVFQTVAVQDIDLWSFKDYGRPKSNPRSGMLPPKVARMMVNCAVNKAPDPAMVVFDPFCGMGTILTEALALNLSVVGSDLSPTAVAACALNLAWFKQHFNSPGSVTTFVSDVHHLNLSRFPQNTAAIVFEGFLGPPHLKDFKIPDYFKGLKKLYIGALKNLVPLLNPGGRLCLALPEYRYKGSVKNMNSLIDSCEKYGYTQVTAPFVYGRTGAMIKRSIYILQKNSTTVTIPR